MELQQAIDIVIKKVNKKKNTISLPNETLERIKVVSAINKIFSSKENMKEFTARLLKDNISKKSPKIKH